MGDRRRAICLARAAQSAARRRPAAVTPLACLSVRRVGLLIPGVVSPDLPAAFARPAAYGDLATAILALLAFAALGGRMGIILVWAFNILGSADLLYAFYQGNRIRLEPELFGAAYFIPTVLAPLLLITHGLVFRLLLRKEAVAAS